MTRRKKQTLSRKVLSVLSHWDLLTIVILIVTSAAMSGFYFGSQINHDVSAKKIKAKINNNVTTVLDDRYSRMLSGFMDQVIGGCFYDLYQQNDTSPTSGNICDGAMLLNKELCKTKHFDACDSEFLRKYLEGMGQ